MADSPRRLSDAEEDVGSFVTVLVSTEEATGTEEKETEEKEEEDDEREEHFTPDYSRASSPEVAEPAKKKQALWADADDDPPLPEIQEIQVYSTESLVPAGTSVSAVPSAKDADDMVPEDIGWTPKLSRFTKIDYEGWRQLIPALGDSSESHVELIMADMGATGGSETGAAVGWAGGASARPPDSRAF